MLNPQHILITRPAGQGQDMIHSLESAGWHCVQQPLLRIAPLTLSDGTAFHIMKQHIMNLDLYDVVISVSGNASNLAADLIDQYWPQMPVGIDWYAVGPSSAQAFKILGINMQLPDGNHSEGLLELAGLQDLSHKKVLILRGVGGREHLANTLRNRGALVEYCELYRRQSIHFEPGALDTLLSKQQIHYALLTSGEMLQQIAQELSDAHKQQLHIIVPSQRIANMAPELNLCHVHVCETISGPGLLSCLNSLNQ